jgi:hypothetical protein
VTKVDALVIAILADDDGIPISAARKMWDGANEEARKGHRGDCTKEPQTCAVCFVNARRASGQLILNYVEDQIS